MKTSLPMIAAGILSALMGALFYKAHLVDPRFSSLSGSFIRVVAAILPLAFILLLKPKSIETSWLAVSRHRELWLWGAFGALTVTTYFSAVSLIGSGQSAFLGASSGIFTTALAPLIARQRVNARNWLCILGSVSGLYLMCQKLNSGSSVIGSVLAIGSGLFGALAYLMVARNRTQYSSTSITAAWIIASLSAHLIIFCFYHVDWPKSLSAWFYLIGAGLAATIAQQFTAFSYQRTPASVVAGLSYLAPVFSLILDIFIFDFAPSLRAGLGAGVILIFGAVVPWLNRSASSPVDPESRLQSARSSP